MTNNVLLNNIDHANLKVITRYGAAYGDSVNQTLVFPTEFAEVQREYPIFLRKDADGAFQAVVLLGFDKGENLFLNEPNWNARYIPAVLQRGPFSIGFQQKGVRGQIVSEAMVHVNLEDKRVNETEGEPVFLPQGGNSPYLGRVAHVLQIITRGSEIAQPIYNALDEAGLLEPVQMEVNLDAHSSYKFPNYYTVAADTLAKLDGAKLERLNKTGSLNAAFLILSSLNNVSRLIDLKNRKRATA
jgi:hypothetical protein